MIGRIRNIGVTTTAVSLLLASVAALGTPFAAQAQCPDFMFQKIADTADTPPSGSLTEWAGFTNGPVVSNTHAGFQAFQAFQAQTALGFPGPQAIYIHDGVSNSLVADLTSPVPELAMFAFYGFDPDMTIEASTIGFEGFIDYPDCLSCGLRGSGDEIVVTAQGTTLTNRADTVQVFNTDFIFNDLDEPSLRDGNVFFRGNEEFDLRGFPVGNGVFTDQGGSVHDLINMGDPVPGLPDYEFFYDAFEADVSSDGTNTAAIGYIFEDLAQSTLDQVVLTVDLTGNATNIADTVNTLMPDAGGPVFSSFEGPAIQNGNVAFWGSNAYFGVREAEPYVEGVYTTLGGTLRKVADTNTQVPGRSVNFASFDGDGIAIYGNRIAFVGRFPIEGALDAFGVGIYVEDNGTLCKVIDTDDTLDGRTPVDFKLHRNEALFANRLGFRATFAGPTTQPVSGGGVTGGPNTLPPQAIFVTLLQPPPAPGACCLPDNTCTLMTQLDCEAAWGTYYGDGSSCTLVECNPSRRVGYHTKGDLFVWPYVKIRWDDNLTPGDPLDDTVLTDTFISVLNDDTSNHRMKFYFVEGRLWNNTNRTLNFTGNQPRYWSAFSGMGGSTSGMSFRALNPLGLPDGPNQNIRKLEGFIIGFTVDDNNLPVKTNQMAGSATVVERQLEAAWEYKPWAFRSICRPVSKDGDPGLLDGQSFKLPLNGLFYQRCPSRLLIDFWATGTNAFGSTVIPPIVPSLQDFEITLMTMYIDLRALPDHDMDGTPGEPPIPGGSAEDSSPPTTAVEVLVWNESEIQVSNTIRCLTCWDTKLASMYGIGGASSPFALSTLQTIKGKARLRGTRDSRCDQSANSPNSQVLVYEKYSKDLPILGVVHKTITWGPDRIAKANSALTASGERTDGCIFLDLDNIGPPPTVASPAAGATVTDDLETLTPPRDGIRR